MKLLVTACCIVCITSLVYSVPKGPRKILALDERWICSIRKSCLDCLNLSHCSWCASNNKCYSKTLPKANEVCQNATTTEYKNYGLSVAENAQCACTEDKLKLSCNAPGDDQVQCSGRGECVCGRCLCYPTPDPDHPTKMVMGEFCEYDNFSCDGPRCNEGPYSISAPRIYEDDSPSPKDLEMLTE